MLAEQKDDLRRAAALSARGDHAGAATILADRLARAGEELQTRIELVRALSAAGSKNAANAAATALEGQVTDEASWREILLLFRKINDPVRMQIVTLRLLRLSPGHEGATVELLKLLVSGRRFDEALERIGAVLPNKNLSADFLHQISQLQIRLQKFKAAAVTAKRAMAQAPEHFDALAGYAQCLKHLGESRAVRDQLPLLTRLAGDDPRRWGWVAEIASWAGQGKQMDAAIAKVLASGRLTDTALLQLIRANWNLDKHEAAYELMARIDLSASNDIELLKRCLGFLQTPPEILAAKSAVNEMGAAAAGRLLTLTGDRNIYEPQLRGFNFVLRA